MIAQKITKKELQQIGENLKKENFSGTNFLIILSHKNNIFHEIFENKKYYRKNFAEIKSNRKWFYYYWEKYEKKILIFKNF